MFITLFFNLNCQSRSHVTRELWTLQCVHLILKALLKLTFRRYKWKWSSGYEFFTGFQLFTRTVFGTIVVCNLFYHLGSLPLFLFIFYSRITEYSIEHEPLSYYTSHYHSFLPHKQFSAPERWRRPTQYFCFRSSRAATALHVSKKKHYFLP